MRKKQAKKETRYPDLRNWFELPDCDRTYKAEYLQAVIGFWTYKGTVQMSITHEDERRSCGGGSLAGRAWLRGDDIDAVVTILRDYKRMWLKEYRKAERADRKRSARARGQG